MARHTRGGADPGNTDSDRARSGTKATLPPAMNNTNAIPLGLFPRKVQGCRVDARNSRDRQKT